MALPQNRKGVMIILETIRPLIIGKEHPGFKCGCGEIFHGPAVAKKIIPAGNEYPGQEIHWYLWSVKLESIDNSSGDNGFSTDLTAFIPVENLDVLFSSHFTQHSDKSPYELEVRGEERYFQELPAAVSILEDEFLIEFRFDWGVEQELAELIFSTKRHVLKQELDFMQIINGLRRINPVVYEGGPKPELEFECNWHLDYADTLIRAYSSAKKIVISNLSTMFIKGQKLPTGANICFIK